MKPMGCDEFLEEVLSPEKPLGAAAAEHLRSCPACAALRADAERVCGACEAEPPAELDRAILGHAKEVSRRRAVRRLFFRRAVPFAATAAAAAFCVAVFLPKDAAPPAAGPGGMRIARSSVRAAGAPGWSSLENLESEAFDLSQELTSCQHMVADWQTM